MQRSHEIMLFVSAWLLYACNGLNAPEQKPAFETCCGGQGLCVPRDLTPDDARDRLAIDSCAENLLCAPSDWALNPDATPQICYTAGEREGRCLWSCLPEVAELAASLEEAGCGEGLLCVPCFDPLSGDDTEACRFGGDQPKAAANLFGHCCGGRGRCVEESLLAQSTDVADLARLDAGGCGDEQRCVPEDWLEAEGPHPTPCRTLGEREGRCLSSCLPEVAERAGQLRQESCAAGELCLPCFDPVSGEDTEACRVAGDRPASPADVFAECCGGQGRCVEEAILLLSTAPEDLARLDPHECDEQQRCAPTRWLETGAPKAETCRTLGEREGRCLPSCLPEVAEQAQQLRQESCAIGELCLPCFDPLSGNETGACRAGGDQPKDPADLFGRCCDGRGRCVEREVLAQSTAPDDLAWLDTEGCKEPEALCVPERWLDEPDAAPRSCRAAGDLEGRCLSDCLPNVAAQADRLQQRSCDGGELCVPCYDPLNGEDTQVCRVGDDAPAEAPRTYEGCCLNDGSALGTCVPIDLLSPEQIDSLPVDSCSQTDTKCVPNDLLKEPNQLTSCSSSLLSESGLCLPSCFLPPLARLVTPTGTCTRPERCVPCSQVAPPQAGCQ